MISPQSVKVMNSTIHSVYFINVVTVMMQIFHLGLLLLSVIPGQIHMKSKLSESSVSFSAHSVWVQVQLLFHNGGQKWWKMTKYWAWCLPVERTFNYKYKMAGLETIPLKYWFDSSFNLYISFRNSVCPM